MNAIQLLDGISVFVGVCLGSAVTLVWWAATSAWDRSAKPEAQPSRPVSSSRKSGRTRGAW